MSLMRLCRHHPWTAIIVVQAVILMVQVAVFYPCLAGTEAADAQARLFEAHPRSKREVGDFRNVRDQNVKTDTNDKQKNRNMMMAQQDQNNVKVMQQNQEKFSQNQNRKIRYEPNWDSLDQRPIPQWFDDAKFGIFIHWGVFSVPSYVKAGSKGLAEWFWFYMDGEPSLGHKQEAFDSVAKFMKENYPPNFKYQNFAPMFTAEFFQPDEWASVFNQSGAKYVVLTSKHHDGYTLWGSKHSWNWNSMDVGPHRDLVGELGTAVRKAGLKYGLYHSLFEWFNPFFLEDKKNKYKTQNFIKEKLTPEMIELVEKYKPEVVWTDGHWMADCGYYNCTNFLAWLYNDSPVKNTVVTNDRWGSDIICKKGDFITCDDRYNPDTKQIKKWENCMTIDKESWGYRRNAKISEYFTIEGLLKTLVKTVSNGGNLLMNIGPTADGRIAPIFEERLKQMGEWLKVNGEAIYETRMWHTTKDSNSKNVYYTKKPGRSGSVIYAILMKWPKTNSLSLSTPKVSKDTVISWVGYKGQLTYSATQDGNVQVTLPKVSMTEIPCLWAWVLKMEKLQNAE